MPHLKLGDYVKTDHGRIGQVLYIGGTFVDIRLIDDGYITYAYRERCTKLSDEESFKYNVEQ